GPRRAQRQSGKRNDHRGRRGLVAGPHLRVGEPTMKRMQLYFGRKLGGLVAAALVGAALTACTPDGPQQEVEFRVPVAVEEVGTATRENRIVTTGTLRPPEIVTLSVLDSGVLEINRGPDGRR